MRSHYFDLSIRKFAAAGFTEPVMASIEVFPAWTLWNEANFQVLGLSVVSREKKKYLRGREREKRGEREREGGSSHLLAIFSKGCDVRMCGVGCKAGNLGQVSPVGSRDWKARAIKAVCIIGKLRWVARVTD